MKIKEGFILREVAGSNVVVPVGDRCESFNGMITLNDTGAFLWSQLSTDKTEEELLGAMLSEYDVPENVARNDISAFIANLKENDLVD